MKGKFDRCRVCKLGENRSVPQVASNQEHHTISFVFIANGLALAQRIAINGQLDMTERLE